MLRLNDYECPKCGFKDEYLLHEHEVKLCPEDGEKMKRLPPVFRINMGPVPLAGYYDDNLQSFVRSNTHRKELMERQGVTEKGATPKKGQAWI